MKITINNITLEINAASLAAINSAIADCAVIKEKYNETTKEYEYKPSEKRAQFHAIEAIETSYSIAK